MTKEACLRILDANANRAREALRVMEDIARFGLDDAALTEGLKYLRHDFAAAVKTLPMDEALLARDTPGDVGTSVKTEAEFTRTSLAEVLTANAKRLSEALRSMEEAAKVVAPAEASALEKLRYRGYALEQDLRTTARLLPGRERFARVRLYVLLTESICGSGTTWERVLDAVLAAARDSGGVRGAEQICVQLREKGLPDAELLRRARCVAARCREAGALFLMNDRCDVARIAGADGVHLGQTDLPCTEVRKLLGPEAIIGVSTERLEQARQALADGTTYLATGPMFHTTTKEKPRIAGPAYAAEVVKAFPGIPVVAIGGITPQNVAEVTATGIKAVAVTASILRAVDPGAVTREFLGLLGAPAA
jgi:thiamine-phosphate pyrophosphorylase